MSKYDMKDLSKAAKLRISADPEARSLHMASLARQKQFLLTPEERKAHSMKMVEARRLKKNS